MNSMLDDKPSSLDEAKHGWATEDNTKMVMVEVASASLGMVEGEEEDWFLHVEDSMEGETINCRIEQQENMYICLGQGPKGKAKKPFL